MMLSVLLLLVALQPSSSLPRSFMPENGMVVHDIRSEVPECPAIVDPTRSATSIRWSCLATIFTCTWVAIHPNISDPRESQWSQFRRHFETMIWAMIAPELVTLWALRQRWAASKIAKQYNDKYYGDGEQVLPGSRTIITHIHLELCSRSDLLGRSSSM